MDEHKIRHDHCPFKPNTTCPTSSIVINSNNLTRTRWNYNPDLPELTASEFKALRLEDYSWIHFEVIHEFYFISQQLTHVIHHIYH